MRDYMLQRDLMYQMGSAKFHTYCVLNCNACINQVVQYCTTNVEEHLESSRCKQYIGSIIQKLSYVFPQCSTKTRMHESAIDSL